MFTQQTFRSKVISIALKENGTLTADETDPTRKYRRLIGIKKGGDWCVAFVYWCFEQASKDMGISNPMLKTGSSGKLFAFAEQYSLFADGPELGDIYISGKKSHTGLIAETNHNYLTAKTNTIEGNTWRIEDVWGVHKRTKDLQDAFFIRL